MKISERLIQSEWIDLGPSHYTPKEYEDCLFQLDRVGRFLGGDKATLQAFSRLKQIPQSILDVGCGGGHFTIRLAQRFPSAKVVGIDISQEAIQYAKKAPGSSIVNFHVPSSPTLDYPPESFDVITSTLVCHHLSDAEIVTFLKQAYRTARVAVVINDLHRHPLAILGYSLIAPILFPNRIVYHDGILSIKRSFTYQDWVAYLKAANIPLHQCRITWHWAFRWIVYINKATS